jgi:hypothetical protein
MPAKAKRKATETSEDSERTSSQIDRVVPGQREQNKHEFESMKKL